MKTLKNVLPRAFICILIFTVICGIVYTAVCTGIAQLLFPNQANGSIIEIDGKKYGCELLAQQYTDESHMWGRIMNIDVTTYTGEDGKIYVNGRFVIEGTYSNGKPYSNWYYQQEDGSLLTDGWHGICL